MTYFLNFRRDANQQGLQPLVVLEHSMSVDSFSEILEEKSDPSWLPSYHEVRNMVAEDTQRASEVDPDADQDESLPDSASDTTDTSTTVCMSDCESDVTVSVDNSNSDVDVDTVDSDVDVDKSEASVDFNEIGDITMSKGKQMQILNEFSLTNTLPQYINNIQMWPSDTTEGSNLNAVIEAVFSTHPANCHCPCMRGFDWKFPNISIYNYLTTHACPRVWPPNLCNASNPCLILGEPDNRFTQLKFLTHTNQADLLQLISDVHVLVRDDDRCKSFTLFELEGQPHDFCLTIHVHCILEHEFAAHNVFSYNVFNCELRQRLCKNTINDVKRILDYEVSRYHEDKH